MSTQSSLCINCNVRPATNGYPHCSKQCAIAGQTQPAQQPNQPFGGAQQSGQPGGGLCINCNARPATNGYPHCSKQCATAAQRQPSQPSGSGPISQITNFLKGNSNNTPPASLICQLPGCGKPVYRDANGPSQYCGMNHLRQGKAAQQSGGPQAGPPHAGPSHAAPPNAQAGICQLSGCNKHVWVDPSGNPSQYCSRGHKAQAAAQPQQKSHWQMGQSTTTPNAPQGHYGGMQGPFNSYATPQPQAPLCWVCHSQPAFPNDMFCSIACIAKGQQMACDILEKHPLKPPPTQTSSVAAPPVYQSNYPNPPLTRSTVDPRDLDKRTAEKGPGGFYVPPNHRRNSDDSDEYAGMPD